jgi:hypothetical protein
MAKHVLELWLTRMASEFGYFFWHKNDPEY